MVGVLGSKAGEDDATVVGFAIAISVLEENDLGGVCDIGSAIGREDGGGNVEVIGKNGAFVGDAVTIRVFQNEDLVVLLGSGDDVGIHSARDEPEAALGIKVHLDRLRDHGVGSHQLDLHAIRKVEGGGLFVRIGVGDVFKAALAESGKGRE